jgi:RNA polymerase sigma factor (sigma-70 family)
MSPIDARSLLAHAQQLRARYARRLGADEAADLVAEAVARGLEHPPADGRMGPWLERIARNLLVDRWRRARLIAALPPELPAPAPDPEQVVLARERRRAVRSSLARLERNQRRTILHRYYEAGSAPAGLSTTTMRTRLHRGLARLRALTAGLVAVPPWRLFSWLGVAANPAALAVVLLAQQAPIARAPSPSPRPAISQPAPLHRPARPAAAPAPTPTAPPTPVTHTSRPVALRAPAPVSPQRYDFEDDQVEGDLQAPDGIRVTSERPVHHSSLIEIPDSFIASVVKSVEDL